METSEMANEQWKIIFVQMLQLCNKNWARETQRIIWHKVRNQRTVCGLRSDTLIQQKVNLPEDISQCIICKFDLIPVSLIEKTIDPKEKPCLF